MIASPYAEQLARIPVQRAPRRRRRHRDRLVGVRRGGCPGARARARLPRRPPRPRAGRRPAARVPHHLARPARFRRVRDVRRCAPRHRRRTPTGSARSSVRSASTAPTTLLGHSFGSIVAPARRRARARTRATRAREPDRRAGARGAARRHDPPRGALLPHGRGPARARRLRAARATARSCAS